MISHDELLVDGPYSGKDFYNFIQTSQLPRHRWYSFKEVLRVLKVGGIFFFTTLGNGTLFELREFYLQSYRELGNTGTPHLHNFIRRNALHNILIEEGFVEVSVESRFEMKYHHGVKDLLINLKTIGAQNASKRNPSGLGKPKVFGRMVDNYEDRYRSNLGIPATYGLLFGFRRKA